MKHIPLKPDVWVEPLNWRTRSIESLFRCEQSREIINRTDRLLWKFWPKPRAPHGFNNPGGAVEHLWQHRHRQQFRRELQAHIKSRVERRDAGATLSDKAERINKPVVFDVPEARSAESYCPPVPVGRAGV